jgi:hypothetical protein
MHIFWTRADFSGVVLMFSIFHSFQKVYFTGSYILLCFHLQNAADAEDITKNREWDNMEKNVWRYNFEAQ